MIWTLTILGFFLGLFLVGGLGSASIALSMAISGFLLGSLLTNNRKIESLKKELESIRSSLRGSDNLSGPIVPEAETEPVSELSSTASAADISPRTDPVDTAEPALAIKNSDTRRPSRLNRDYIDSGDASKQDDDPWSAGSGDENKPATVSSIVGNLFSSSIVKRLSNFFVTGNVVLKVGVIVLFVGVGFLLKFAVDNNLLPIELRLSATALGAIGLLIFGWKIRSRNKSYGLTVQGAAMGILYMTVFASAGLYDLVPLVFAFAVMTALVGFTCMLAVLQDSKSLAVFAAVGGFAAPILTSSSSGNHVALFSYYAFLNTGIVAVAWFKSWRLLNWIGFVFTFVVGLAWGVLRYQETMFASTEPFLILFFLMFVATSVLYAHKQPVALKGLVDGSLVFGVPIASYSMQSALVSQFEYGMAYTSIAMGLFYIGLARVLWSRQVAGMRLLTESFLSLGVIFTSLSIPYVLDGQWVAAAWGLEGAAMLWIGYRQNRVLPRVFGVILQLGAGAAFLAHPVTPGSELMFLNGTYIGSLLVAVGGLLSAWLMHSNRDRMIDQEDLMIIPILVWGLSWWWFGGIGEILRNAGAMHQISYLLLFFCAGSLLLTILAKQLNWHYLALSILIFPAAVAVLFVGQLGSGLHPFENLGFIAWSLTFASLYRILFLFHNQWVSISLRIIHPVAAWLVLIIYTWGLTAVISAPGLATWIGMLWGIIPALAVFLLPRLDRYANWPFGVYPEAYQRDATFPIAVYCFSWVLFRTLFAADPAPLPYIPIINPQDLSQLAVMAVLADWILRLRKYPLFKHNDSAVQQFAISLGVLAFLWLNALIAHIIHFYLGVAYNLPALTDSSVFQSTISIIWTSLALIGMSVAKRTTQRKLWIVSAGLLAITVVKLFIVDLGDIGTVARIVSFISVGGLMLVIGYLAPIPPSRASEPTDDEAPETSSEVAP